MNMEIIKAGVIKLAERGILQTKKFAPEILTTAGIVGVVTAAVMASKATLELETSLEYSKDLRKRTKEKRENVSEEDYPARVYEKDIVISYVRAGQSLSKLYGPSVALGTASIICLLAAHGIMRQRNAALVVAYNTVNEAFKAYRKRVIEDLGEEKDWDYRHGIREETVETVGEDGKKKTEKVLTQDPKGYSQYAKFFDEANVHWEKDPEHNLFFLNCQNNAANDKFRRRGHMFLNEVYDMLGMERTKAGAVVGWILNENGDNYIDFGIFDITKPRARDFVNGFERSILLDFNVDGTIYDRI